MAWNPSVPPAPTCNNCQFDADFDGLRFVLVKLDNFSLHIKKPTWSCPLEGGDYRYSTLHNFNGYKPLTGGSGYLSGSIGSVGCVTGSPFGYQSSWNMPSSACVPFISGLTNSGCCAPLNGFSTMANCEEGTEPGNGHAGGSCGILNQCNAGFQDYMDTWACQCTRCRRGPNSVSCDQSVSNPPGHNMNYSTHSSTNVFGINPGAGTYGLNNGNTWQAAEGKGAYNDTKWMATLGGPLLWGSPAVFDANHNNKNFYAVGMTMQDITSDSSFVFADYCQNQNGPGAGTEVGNVIYPITRPTGGTDSLSYYAIILIPTVTSQAQPNVLKNKFSFKLHHENDSVAYQKLLGYIWPDAGSSSGTWMGSTGHGSASPNYIVDSLHNNSWSYSHGTDGEAYIAQSNTGYMHGQNYYSDDEYNQMYGGIMDGEFISLDDGWWEASGTDSNPWNKELLSPIQKHMIAEACYARLDPALVPVGDDKQTTILITRTPACTPHWQYFSDTLRLFNGGSSNGDGIDPLTDNPYFNLHMTASNTGKTAVFKDVVTGLQDSKYGKEQDPPVEPNDNTTIAGLTIGGNNNYPFKGGLNGMTIAAELVQDWESLIFSGSSFNWDDVKVHTLRTVGWDSHIQNTGGAGSGVTSYMGPGTETRGAFYEFDARTYIDRSPGILRRRITHIYGDATDNGGCVGKIDGHHPVSAIGGHGNTSTTNNSVGVTSEGWNDSLYAICYMGLGGSTTGNVLFQHNSWPSSYPVSLMDSGELLTYMPSTPSAPYTRYVDHSTGNYIWPDYSNSEIIFKNDSNIIAYNTHHTTIPSKNQWAICTGNGMIYNTTSVESPITLTLTEIPALCAGGYGAVTVFLTGYTAPCVITSITFNNGYSSTQFTFPQTATGANEQWVYTAVPVGTYTVTVVTAQGTESGSVIVTAPSADVSFSFDGAVVLSQPTCSGPGTIQGQFDASNISGGAITNNGNIQWTLFELIGATWTFHSTGQPFTGANIYGSGSGVAPACPNINSSGNVCNNKKFNVTGVNGGTYRLILHNTSTAPNNATVFANWYQAACMYAKEIDLIAADVSLTATIGNQGYCALADNEIGYWSPIGALTGDGFIDDDTAATPTNFAQFGVTVANGVAPYLWVAVAPNGATYNAPSSASTAYSSGNGTGPMPSAMIGVHTISITDANGCQDTISVTIIDPSPTTWTSSSTTTNAPCNGGNGTISGATALNGNGCAGAMSYALSTTNAEVWNTTTFMWELPSIIATWQPTSTFSVPAGTYYLWAKNTCGCAIVAGSYTITGAAALSSTIAVTNPGCSGGVASMAVSASGGTGPYTYLWSTVGTVDPLFPTTAPTGTSFTQTVPGGSYDYECLVTDSNGCTQILTASTIAGIPLGVTAVVSQISCVGGNNGSINVTVVGGIGPFSYQWSGSSTATTQDLSTLAVGTYTLLVTDSTPTTACTVTTTWIVAATGGAETWIDMNQYVWSGYNTPYLDGTTGTTADNNTYGKYGGPTCPSSCDGTIRLVLDDSAPVYGASFPFDVWLSNDGGVNYYQVTDNGGTALSIATTDLIHVGTGIAASSGVAYDPQTGVDGVDYFELTGNLDKWNPGGGAVVLPFCENSTWHIKLIESGASACVFEFSTTILLSDYRTVDNQVPAITHPTCCGCSSYGASLGTNVCNGAIDVTPHRGTYENHSGSVAYTYLWTYATLPSTCAVPGHNNSNTQWSNLTTQDLTTEWPGIYTIVTTDSCAGTDTDILTLNDPIVYIDDITWVPPQCTDCCTGEMTLEAHGGDSNLEISFNHGVSYAPFTSGTTFYGKEHPSTNFSTYGFEGCGGIYSIWVRDSSACVTEYLADPDDGIILASYPDNCFANANTAAIISTSGTWAPTYNNPTVDGTVATAAAFAESSPTKIELIPVSNFTDAVACVVSHNIIPGDTNGEISLQITGGTGPYEIAIVAQPGPFYSPITGMTPCLGIGPLTTTDMCTMTGTAISSHGPGLDGSTVMSMTDGTGTNLVSSTTPITTSDTFLQFTNVSVSRDLGYGALGAEYIFYVRDAHGCYQTSHVGVDNGIFGIISIYGAINCDCVCPIGFTYNEDTEECDSAVAAPTVSNGTVGYWTRSVNLYTGQILPVQWQSGGCALYGVYTGLVIDYTLSITVNTNDLPFLKDIVTNVITSPFNIYRSASLVTQIGTDLTIWNTVGSTTALNTRVRDIAIWLDQPSPAAVPPIPIGEWIGVIMETNFALNTPAIIAMASDAQMRMKVDGIVWIDMVADETVPTTGMSNNTLLNLFPIVLPGGLHTIAFEVYNTLLDAYMAFEIYANQDSTTGNYFIGDAVGNAFSVADIDNYTLEDVNGNKLSSLTFDFEEIQLGDTNYGFSCLDPTDVVSYTSGTLFCTTDVTAPCEVPLDCGYCLSDVGVPQPQWTKKGPCVDADDGAIPIPNLLNNVWIVDFSELSDLVECPGALANIAYAKILGALATKTLDVRQVWMTIIIRHLLHNLNTCMTLSDIQDLFAGFLDDVCPTCDTAVDLTPAQMEALTSIFTLNINSNFDF